VPEVVVAADTKAEAAALALGYFISKSRPLDAASYLQSEPQDAEYLRVHDVLRWLETPEGRAFGLCRGITVPQCLHQIVRGSRLERE
jgi:hypothetical protein